MMRFVLMCLVVLACISTTPVNTNSAPGEKQTIKILIIQSYTFDHVCGKPQRDGFLSVLKKYNKQYNFHIKSYYMKTKSVNVATEQKRKVSKFVCEKIHAFEPDIVVTVDDNAFQYVLVENMLHHYKKNSKLKVPRLYFTGLNRPYKHYVESAPLLRQYSVSGVEERTVLSKMFLMFSNSKFIPNKYYILSDDTTTSYYLTQNYVSELKRNGKAYEIINVGNVRDLNRVISSLNKKPVGVIMNALQSIEDTEYGVRIVKESITKLLIKWNKRHIEFGGNVLYTRYGVSLGISPNFFSMGETVGNLVMNDVQGIPNPNRIVSPDNIVSVNKNRLAELGCASIMLENLKVIDGELN